MSKASILVVEDEPLIADGIASTLEKHGFEVVDVVDEAGDALESIRLHQPDLALLDVNIEGAMDGIQLAGKLTIPFIFLTSYYDQRTLDRAKTTGPAGYLVKPYKEMELIANVEMALAKQRMTPVVDSTPRSFFVRDKNELVALSPDDILFAESDNNYTTIYTLERKLVLTHTLKATQEKLEAYGFERVHKSYLVNFRKISSISEGYLYIQQHKIPMGRAFKEELINKLTIL